MPTIAQLLDQARRELLELGLRNTLLNYRLTKGRGVEVAGATATDLFRRLVQENEELSFAPSDYDPSRARTRSTPLLTAHDEKSLQSRLLGSYHAARTHIEERGVNILFMAVGMLHWYEEESSERELKAPLILIPVELSRTSAQEKFKLRYSEEDVEGNQSLAAKLTEFAIKYPAFPDIEDLDPTTYFDAVQQQIAGQNRWRLERDEIALGFFSFSKFLMFKDLDPEKWCSEQTPDACALLSAMLRDGFCSEPPSISEDQYLDKVIAPNALKQVMDADSSQALAMLDVRAGRNLVIQGPPGTGKSQTITNLIADALGTGKRVLFVAEKNTALDVVKRRLDKVNLGDACLELHSHSANKKAVLSELQRTLQLGRPRTDGLKWNLEQFKQIRDRLNAYCLAVNTPIGETTWTPHQLMGELLKATRECEGVSLTSARDVFQEGSDAHRDVLSWTRDILGAKQEIVQQLQSHLERMGSPAQHPFRNSQLEALLPSDRGKLAEALKEAIASIQVLTACLRDLAQFMGIAARATRDDADLLARAARRALGAPHLTGIDLRTGDWAAKRDEIRATLEAGQTYSAVHQQFDPILIPEAWEQDLLQARQTLNTTGRKWWRWFSSDYRAVRKQVAGLYQGEHPRDPISQLAIVDAIMQAARLRKQIAEQEALVSRLFGVQWQGLRSDWQVLQRLNEWVVDVYREMGDGRLPGGIIDFLAGTPSLDALKAKVTALEQALPVFDRRVPEILAGLAYSDAAKAEALKIELPVQLAAFERMVSKLESISDIVRLNNLRTGLNKEGLGWVFDKAWDWPEASRLLVQFFRSATLEPLLRSAYNEREALRTGDGLAQTNLQETFQEQDLLSLRATQLELAGIHHASLPQMNGYGQIGVLAREFQKKSRHLPIRKLISEAGNAIAAIKPVFMMSPMSVAAFIPPKTLEFDLVIFDEASQVKPVDGLGAILRGAQLVVVGDSKQLPPTSFFDSLVSASDNDADEEENVAADVESILGLALARGVPERMLRWHYRSRHHSLIELSNSQFYDSRLVVFPSPEPNNRKLGLHFHHLPGTAYDRGKSRTNQLEALAVAKAVMQHAKSTPHLTLGVAAFSLQQAGAITDEIEQLRRLDSSTESFFSAHPHERFFVKNLESVQGDERDVILISVGYGRTETRTLAMDFGALNRQGGERRLNVLITRARRCCEVFSNLTDEDIDLDRSSKRGVAALKAFLKYARTGISEASNRGEAEEHSPFEAEVATALRRLGHEVALQVGSGGFKIDLGVRDPEREGRYVLGIECDGATYHSCRSARDRDRLRQQVLEGLGWNIHRVWSTDWFHNPERELTKVIAAIETSRATEVTPAEAPVIEPAIAPEPLIVRDALRDIEVVASVRGAPYTVSPLAIDLQGSELHSVSPARFTDWIAQIVHIESPVHEYEVVRRIAQAAGITRIGNRIEKSFAAGVQRAVMEGAVRKHGEFLWSTKQTALVARDRSALESGSRKIELVAPEEIDAAVLQLVESSHGIDADYIPAAVSKMLGFARASEEIAQVIRASIERLKQNAELKTDERGHVQIAERDRSAVS